MDPREGVLVHRAHGTIAGPGWGTNLGTHSHSCAILPRAQCHSPLSLPTQSSSGPADVQETVHPTSLQLHGTLLTN